MSGLAVPRDQPKGATRRCNVADRTADNDGAHLLLEVGWRWSRVVLRAWNADEGDVDVVMRPLLQALDERLKRGRLTLQPNGERKLAGCSTERDAERETMQG